MLHLIRHGTTTTSGKTFAGRSDVPLNDEGRQMARNIMRQLAQDPIDRIVSSPSSRAVDTARPLADRIGLEIEQDPRLFEIDFGDYEGLAKAKLGLKLRKSHAFEPIPGGEALIDVWTRAGDFLRTLQPNEGHIAVVGHFWLNRMIFGHMSHMNFDNACRSRSYRPETGSVVALTMAFGGNALTRP